MAFSEFEVRRIEKLADEWRRQKRPPVHIRDQLDIGYRISDQSLELFEIRPLWTDPNQQIEESIAKTTYVKKSKIWKIYWQRADLKWHRYDAAPEVDTLEEFFEEVERDEWACFYG